MVPALRDLPQEQEGGSERPLLPHVEINRLGWCLIATSCLYRRLPASVEEPSGSGG